MGSRAGVREAIRAGSDHGASADVALRFAEVFGAVRL